MDQLPEELLLDIFARLSSDDLRCSAPLVCKAWHRLAAEPSSLWHSIRVDLRTQTAPPLRGPAQRWFRARAERLASLALLLPAAEAGFAADVLAVLGEEPGLRRFVADFGGAPAVAVSTCLAQLGWLRRLQVLYLAGIQGPVSGAQLGGLRQLRHLRVAHLQFAGSSARQLQDGFPAALLACSRLEELTLAGAGEYSLRSLPEGLSRLQRLRSLSLLASGVHALPPSFTALTSLQALRIVDQPPPKSLRLPPCLAGLEQLASVELGCREVPVSLGSLPGLRDLTLWGLRPSCRRSHDVEAEFAALLAELPLERLALRRGRLGTPPAALQHLAGLRSLALSDCGLTWLPEGPYLQQLTRLELPGNCFRGVPEAALAAPRLQTLAMLEGEPPLRLAERQQPGWAARLAAVAAALQTRLQQAEQCTGTAAAAGVAELQAGMAGLGLRGPASGCSPGS